MTSQSQRPEGGRKVVWKTTLPVATDAHSHRPNRLFWLTRSTGGAVEARSARVYRVLKASPSGIPPALQPHWQVWRQAFLVQVARSPARRSADALAVGNLDAPTKATVVSARAFSREFFYELPELWHLTPGRVGFCDVVRCRFGTAFDSRA